MYPVYEGDITAVDTNLVGSELRFASQPHPTSCRDVGLSKTLPTVEAETVADEERGDH